MIAPKKRYWWLVMVITKNKYTIGAEIGVNKGKTSARLLKYCPSLHLIAVDKWEQIIPDPNGEKIGCEENDMEKDRRLFMRVVFPFRHRLTVLRGDSVEMAEKVEDNSLDFIFIDADHRYEAVKADIRAWTPKLKPGGLLSGHDINYVSVHRAVEELIPDFEEVGFDYIWFAKKEDFKG